MQKINKRGLSEVIFISVVIILSVVAVGSVFVAVRPVIDLSPETSCAAIKLSEPRPISHKTACFNQDSLEIELTLLRQTSEDINTIDFIINGEEYFCGDGCINGKILDDGETQTYFFQEQYTEGMRITYGINSCFFESVIVEPACS